METIYYEPNEVWNALQQVQETQILTIAESKYGDLGAYMDEGKMYFIVTTNYCQPIEEEITDEDQCELVCKELISDYISEYDYDDDAECEIAEREEEIDAAISDFIISVTGKLFFPEDNEEMTEKIKNHFLEYLYTECKLDPYRPMILVDEETGSEIYTEYPYKYLV